MAEIEKDNASHHSIAPVKTPDTDATTAIDPAAERRLLWKCDLHVLPILMVLYLLAFCDRINIGNARIQGLEKDLHMKGNDYNIALFIFFIPYILCEVPSNLILKNVAPSTWLSAIMLGWGIDIMFPFFFLFPWIIVCILIDALGIITVCQGVTQSFGGLVACRFLLGVFEAGFVPGS